MVTSPFGRLLQGPKMVGVEVPLDLDPTKFVRSEAVTPAGMFQGHIWKPCIWGQDLFRTLNQIRQNCVTKEGTFGTTSCGVCHWPKKKQGLFGSLSQKISGFENEMSPIRFSKKQLQLISGDLIANSDLERIPDSWKLSEQPHLRCYHQYGGGTLFGFLQHFATHCEAWLRN